MGDPACRRRNVGSPVAMQGRILTVTTLFVEVAPQLMSDHASTGHLLQRQRRMLQVTLYLLDEELL